MSTCTQNYSIKTSKNTPYKRKNRYYRRIQLDKITAETKSPKKHPNLKKLYWTTLHGLNVNAFYYSLNNIVNREGESLASSLNNEFNKHLKQIELSKEFIQMKILE